MSTRQSRPGGRSVLGSLCLGAAALCAVPSVALGDHRDRSRGRACAPPVVVVNHVRAPHIEHHYRPHHYVVHRPRVERCYVPRRVVCEPPPCPPPPCPQPWYEVPRSGFWINASFRF